MEYTGNSESPRIAIASSDGFNDDKEHWFEVYVHSSSSTKNSIGIGVATSAVSLNGRLDNHHGGAYYSDGYIGHSNFLHRWHEAPSYRAGSRILGNL